MAKITTLRLPDPLKARATEYADQLGISLNALLAVALKDYLDAREGRAGAGAKRPASPRPASAASQTIPRVGRNEPCPCGSGRKYKLCHGR